MTRQIELFSRVLRADHVRTGWIFDHKSWLVIDVAVYKYYGETPTPREISLRRL
jgi:hypothetical protein